jgi:glycosyltransferase involved in cell wall biosynthesis
MNTLSVVMPAYNEADNLPVVVPQVVAVARTACPEGFEIVVVDDGSTDGTGAVLRELSGRFPELRIVTHERNRGLTGALRTGFYAAAKRWVIFIPADGQCPAEQIADFVRAAPGADLVLSCYHHRPDGVVRAAMSRGLRLLLWATLGFADRMEGPYLFRRGVLDEMELVAERSAGSIGFEIAAKVRAKGGVVRSITIHCAPRLSGKSKVANARSVVEYLDEIARIRRSMRK